MSPVLNLRGKQQALPRLLLCSLQMVPVASASSLGSCGIHSHQISPVISISAHYCLTLVLSLPLTQLLPLLSFKSPGSPGIPLGLPSHFPLWCFFCCLLTVKEDSLLAKWSRTVCLVLRVWMPTYHAYCPVFPTRVTKHFLLRLLNFLRTSLPRQTELSACPVPYPSQ